MIQSNRICYTLPMMKLDSTQTLPADRYSGTLLGRVAADEGPCVALVAEDGVFDVTNSFATVSALLEVSHPAAALRGAPRGRRLGSLDELLAAQKLLAPIDLQAVKAAGVTFAKSLVERVVEEQARGAPEKADEVRRTLVAEIGVDLSQIKPGSEDAMRLKSALQKRGLWSQYLEVGIGPDVEIFTKCQPMAAVGTGAAIGIHPKSTWNNPEPEIVLVVNSKGTVQGATLGNDVNLRDFEGRSALLLSKAKDNTGSTAIGPLLRLFDKTFSMDDVRRAEIALRVEGTDGFVLKGRSSMSEISRDPEREIVGQAIGKTNQFPDGFAIFLGTMFAPTEDRGEKGAGFTHKVGDVVTISSERLGALVNRVESAAECPRWEFGVGALMRNLAKRGLL
jgi:fumarylacetoacetate (FAA) hydrolase family protein